MNTGHGSPRGVSSAHSPQFQSTGPAADRPTDPQWPEERDQVCREDDLAPRLVGRWKSASLQKGEPAFHRQRPTAEELSVPKQLHELEEV